MLMKIHCPSPSPAAAVTTYAAARASSQLGTLRSHRSPGPCFLPHPHWGCVTIPVDIPDDSSLGMGGNGMDKGEFGSSLGSEIFMEIHRFLLRCGSGDRLRCRAGLLALGQPAHRNLLCLSARGQIDGKPPKRHHGRASLQIVSGRGFSNLWSVCRVGEAIQRVWFCWLPI
jgi:hypothetical protein